MYCEEDECSLVNHMEVFIQPQGF